MNLRRAPIILVGPNGYAQFMRLHRMSVLHAERTITEQLETVIAASTHPLTAIALAFERRERNSR